jgi:hypothetical protein
MDISPADSPASVSPAHSQAEPSISENPMEEEVEPEPAEPEESLTEARGNRRKRPTSALLPERQNVESGPSQGSPSVEGLKKTKKATAPAPQAQPINNAPAKKAAVNKPPVEGRIPPIIICDATKWTGIFTTMNVKRINFSKAKQCIDGIRVIPVTADDFRALTHLLGERRVPCHSFAFPEEKALRAVLRTVPVEIGFDDMKSDLVGQGLAPLKVTRMISIRIKKLLPLVLVEVSKDQGKILELRSVCHLVIAVDLPHKKRITAQCHCFQRFHHSQRNCYAQPM